MRKAKPPVVQTDTSAPLTGSIADVAARLALWGRRAPKGLARVEFVSDFSRQEVVSQLRAMLPQDKPLHEIELPFQQPAIEVVHFLRERLRKLTPGVVSITGFATAFSDDCPLADSLRVLNFHRDNLAQFPLCQTWWMPRIFAEIFLRSVPDLDSWFILRLSLAEVTINELLKAPLMHTTAKELIDPDEARKQSVDYIARIEKAIANQASAEELIMLVGVATNLLHKAELETEEQELLPVLFVKIIPTLVREGFIDATSHMPNPNMEMAKVVGPNISNLSIMLRVLAQMYERSGKLTEAEAYHRASLRVAESLYKPWFNDRDMAYHFLAQFYIKQHRYYDAEAVCKQWLEVLEQSDRTVNDHVIYALSELAEVFFMLNKYAEVEQLYNKRYNKLLLLAEDNPNAMLYLMDRLYLLEIRMIDLYKRLGRYEEAEALSQRRAKIQSKT